VKGEGELAPDAPGGSPIVDFEGRLLAQADAGPGEKIVFAPIEGLGYQ
jgi:predicted amidohydrolase